ncbi:MAG TPA: prephenate dehydrogenase [Mycobacteriales bacterium]|nr:prephenate dehydrogenase [Mycobacteriales bacterium]
MSPVEPPRRVLVVGAGMIGTSIGLRLRSRGHELYLDDRDSGHLETAIRLGAGRPLTGEHVELAVLAVPPGAVVEVVSDLVRRNLCDSITDTSSVKSHSQNEIEILSVQSSSSRLHSPAAAEIFTGGHPIAGRERSGPGAARPDLFEGRVWVLTPSQRSRPEAIEAARWLVGACGATAIEMTPEEHDRALAATSHVPQFVASALAAQFAELPDSHVRLAGPGLRDMTRIAESDPDLWVDIAQANAGPLAAALDQVSARLASAAAELRRGKASGGLRDLLEAGRAGRRRLPDKHGGSPRVYGAVAVIVSDEPGQLARLLADAGAAGINIEDLRVDHSPGLPVGIVELLVRPESVAGLSAGLAQRGWPIED